MVILKMEFLTNPSWWMQLAIQAVVGAGLIVIIKKIYSLVSNKFTNPFKKKGFIGRFIRYFDLKNLRKIRVILKDETQINRETIKQYAYLSIFLLSMMIYFWLLICLSILSEDFRVYSNKKAWIYNVFVLIIGSPMFIFEILYLNQKSLVDKIFKFRKK